MPKLVVDKTALNFTIVNLRATAAQIQRAERVAIALAGRRLREAVEQNMSIPPIGGTAASHAEALSDRDHPYARRHGAIRIRPSGGFPGFGRPELLVHTVSGRLRKAIRGVYDSRGPAYTVRVDEGAVPHARFVIRGTRVMLGRDIVWETAIDPAVQRELRRVIVRVLGEVFRTQSAVRFT